MEFFSFLYVGGLVLLWSYQRAKRKGVPWFSWGQPQRRATAAVTRHNHPMRNRLRTGNIKPKSPWLQEPQVDRSKLPSIGSEYEVIAENAAFRRLTQLTHSDEVSQRMIESVKERNPDKTLHWCTDKAIYDIQRDRMS